MSGIVPPSIVTYQYVVDNDFSHYVNVSFPFRVRIKEVWFTGDQRLLGQDLWDSQANSNRILTLAGMKSKSPKAVLSSYDTPTDWAPFFGYDNPGNQDGWVWGSEQFKPQVWLGLPDQQNQETLRNQTTQFAGTPYYGAGFRSSSAAPVAKDAFENPYWGNDGWSWEEFGQHKYKTDMGVMNPDEMVSFFLYQSGGNWDNYQGDGIATICIAYEGVGAGVEPGAVATPWSDWFYD